MNKKIILTVIFYLHLVGSQEKEVDGSYTRMDKIKHLAELRPISERKFEYKFLDMIFEIIVDLPAHIHGLKPFLFCPEIIVTLFLNDNNHNLYQCDAAGITSNTVTLICQQLDVKSVTCAERHEKYMPVFLKSSNGTVLYGSNNENDNSLKIILIILLIVVVVIILPLLIWSIVLQRKSIRIFNGNNNNDNNPPHRAEVVYNQQNGVHIPLIQNGGNATGALQNEPPNNEIQLEINDSLVVRKQQLHNEAVMAKETSFAKSQNHSIQCLGKKADEKNKSTSLLLDLANTIPVTSNTTVHANNEQSKKHVQPENQCELFSLDFKQPTNVNQSSPSNPSEDEKSFEKGSSSSLEILTDNDEDEWVMDTKQKDKNLITRMLSQNSSVKSRLSKLCGNNLFAKAAHVVILGRNDVIAFETANKRLTKFSAAVDYSFYPPKIGVDYESPSVITPNVIENSKTCQLPIKECYTAHGIQQFYIIEIDKKERLIQAETVVIDLIRKAAKSVNPNDTVAFIYPAYFTEKQKTAYLHAAHNSDFWNLELVDEQLALGYSISKITKKYFVLVNCYEKKAVVSLFRYETEKCRKMIEMDEIEKSGKEIGQIFEAICFIIKERTHSEMPIYVARNKQIFDALKQHNFEDSTFTLKFFDNPEEILVKGECPNFLPLRYENITLNAKGDIKFSRSMSEKSQTLSELGPLYNSLNNCNSEII